jgi:hypothetical protein
MISQKAKLSAVRNALTQVLFAYRCAHSAKQYHDELKGEVEQLAAGIPEPVANGKIGKADFQKSAVEKLLLMFINKLGKPIDPAENQKQAYRSEPPVKLVFRSNVLGMNELELSDGMRSAMRGRFILLPCDPTWGDLVYMGRAVDGEDITQAVQMNLMDFGIPWVEQYMKDFRLPDNLIELWALLHFLVFEADFDTDYPENDPRRTMAFEVYAHLRSALIAYDQLLGSFRRIPRLISED